MTSQNWLSLGMNMSLNFFMNNAVPMIESFLQSKKKKGRIFFLDVPGSTGKTFVTISLLSKVRQQRIALAIALSGITDIISHEVFNLTPPIRK